METLSVIVISAREHKILLPSALVEQVFPFAPPLQLDEKSAFIIGAFLYQYEKLPMIDFFPQEDSTYHNVVGTMRMIMISSVTTASGYPHYAVLSRDEPITIPVDESQLIEVPETGELPPFMQMKVMFDKDFDGEFAGKIAYIPDLIKLEQEIYMI